MLSLTLNVIAVFLAMLAKQWVSEANQGLEMQPDAKKRALLRYARFLGQDKYKLDGIVGALPSMLHVSIILFCGGLMVTLLQYHPISAYVITSFLAMSLLAYIVTTIIGVFSNYSPFQNPLVRA